MFLAKWFYNCEFDEIMTTYIFTVKFTPDFFKTSDKNTAIALSYSQFHNKNTTLPFIKCDISLDGWAQESSSGHVRHLGLGRSCQNI